MRGFLSNYAELPGSVLLAFVACWQIFVVNYSSSEAEVQYKIAVGNQIVDICGRLDDLQIANGRRPGGCEYYPFDPPEYETRGSHSWHQVNEFSSVVEKYIFWAALVLFIAGIHIRIHLSPSSETSKKGGT